MKNNPRLTAPQIAGQMNEEWNKQVSPQTIRRTLKSDDFNGRVARRKPNVSEVNRKRRLNFAKEYIQKVKSWWNDVIFDDESLYKVFGSNGRKMVWRRPNQELQKINLQPTGKYGGAGVMVWGCVSASGVGELVFIDGIMDKHKYLQLLKDNLRKSAEKLGVLETFKFYQDNDPKHMAYEVRSWLLYNCPKVIQTPPRSPDLNSIENLWDELDCRIRTSPITSSMELKKKLVEEWNSVSRNYTKIVVSCIPQRLNAVLRQKSLPTNY